MKALNLSQDAMEALCVKQLKKGQAIWFACDAGAFGARKEGIWEQRCLGLIQFKGRYA